MHHIRSMRARVRVCVSACLMYHILDASHTKHATSSDAAPLPLKNTNHAKTKGGGRRACPAAAPDSLGPFPRRPAHLRPWSQQRGPCGPRTPPPLHRGEPIGRLPADFVVERWGASRHGQGHKSQAGCRASSRSRSPWPGAPRTRRHIPLGHSGGAAGGGAGGWGRGGCGDAARACGVGRGGG